MNELRYALRLLRKSPGFAAAAVLSLAVGIGGSTAIFSLVNAILLRPLSYREPQRLYTVWETVPKLSHIASTLPVNALHFQEWQAQATTLEGIAAFGSTVTNLTGSGEPERLGGARVSTNFFSVLGVQPQVGRTFAENEDHVVIISDSLWRRRFQADPHAVGRAITLDAGSYTVIGVLPPRFPFPRGRQLNQFVSFEADTDVFKPLIFNERERVSLGDHNFAAIARLKTGFTPEQAHSELNVIQARFVDKLKLPEKYEMGALLVPLDEALVGKARQGLVLMLAAVGLVVLMVCVNVANLLLARAPLRRKEIAVRLAMGAGRARLIRQLLTESLLLAALGGALGVLAAGWSVKLLATRIPVDLPRIEEVSVDARVLLYALGVSLLSGILFGLAPALRASRLELHDALKEGGRASTLGPRAGRLRGALVGVEVGLSVLLLVGAGLLLRSFDRLLSVDKGFDAESVLTVDLFVPQAKYSKPEQRESFFRRVLERAAALPGVRAAALVSRLPLTSEGNSRLFTLAGMPVPPIFERPMADFRWISATYFQAMGIPLRRGRIFEYRDRNQRVALVSEKTAAKLWPGQDPIGKAIHVPGPPAPPTRIIGVVGDVRGSALEKEPATTIYEPYWQRQSADMSLVVRTALDAAALAPVLRREVWNVDSEVPVPPIRTMEQIVSASVSQRRFQMVLLLLFGGVALLLASVGIYGVVSYSVAQRTHEIGIRMALGAQAGDVLGLVLRQGLAPVAAGLAAGLAAAFALARVLRGMLYGITEHDPLTITASAAVLVIVALVACWIPARRAVRVDATVALRYE